MPDEKKEAIDSRISPNFSRQFYTRHSSFGGLLQ